MSPKISKYESPSPCIICIIILHCKTFTFKTNSNLCALYIAEYYRSQFRNSNV